MLSTDPPAAHLRNRHGEPLGVLVVEDETMVALMLRELLQELGCQITGWATTADEAERLAAATPPDLVLMDIRLKGARRPRGGGGAAPAAHHAGPVRHRHGEGDAAGAGGTAAPGGRAVEALHAGKLARRALVRVCEKPSP